jgi:hypothetical protein
MTIQSEIDYWKSKFRILADWEILYDENTDYTGRGHHVAKTKKAAIFPWGEGEQEEDYIYHEILHICQCHLRYLYETAADYKIWREAEEKYVQDVCAAWKEAKGSVPSGICRECGRTVYSWFHGQGMRCPWCSPNPRPMDMEPLPDTPCFWPYKEDEPNAQAEDEGCPEERPEGTQEG